MRTLVRRIVLLALLGVSFVAAGACATSSDASWIHPDTGSVPPRAAPTDG